MFKVEMLYTWGWADAEWTIDHGRGPKPMRFKTRQAAQDEIDEHCKETRRAVRRGDMTAPDRASDYRVVEAR